MPVTKDLLIKNGGRFRKHFLVRNRRIIVRNTCSFDSIIQILAVSAIDYEKYCEHITNSENNTCGFILVLIDSGVKKHVYLQRCTILKDFIPEEETHSLNSGMFESGSPRTLRVVDVTTSISKMWAFLMPSEPSLFRVKSCKCGYRRNQEVSMLYINTHIIEKEGYKALEKAIVIHPVLQEMCIEKNCGSFIQEEMKPNGHVIIDTEVSVEKIINKKNEHVLMTCNVIDFPVHISILGEKFRYRMLINFL